MPLLIIGGVVVLGSMFLCGCGVAVWLAGFAPVKITPERSDQDIQQLAALQRKEREEAAQTDQHRAKAFLLYWLQLLQMKNLDEPYRLSTKKFQERMSREKFADLVTTKPDIKTDSPGFSHMIDPRPGDRFAFQMSSGVRNFNIWIIRDGIEWRVDRLEE